MTWVINLIQILMNDKFTGTLNINFSNGGICSADKISKEHIKP